MEVRTCLHHYSCCRFSRFRMGLQRRGGVSERVTAASRLYASVIYLDLHILDIIRQLILFFLFLSPSLASKTFVIGHSSYPSLKSYRSGKKPLLYKGPFPNYVNFRRSNISCFQALSLSRPSFN